MRRATLETRTALATGVIIAAFGLAACAPAQPATSAPPAAATPTQASAPTSPPQAAATATQAPAPTSAPTAAPPTAAPPTATSPRENVAFSWAPGSVTPADSDDVDEIVRDLRAHAGILSGTGNETELNIVYDPTVITVAEIMDLLKQIGHPVVVK